MHSDCGRVMVIGLALRTNHVCNRPKGQGRQQAVGGNDDTLRTRVVSSVLYSFEQTSAICTQEAVADKLANLIMRSSGSLRSRGA